jgi:deoxyribodipyrimidine photo-lyase
MSDKIILWYRNDLRLHDHEGWQMAANAEWVLPVYVIDENLFRTLQLGFTKTGALRAQFLLETLAELREALQKRGSDLAVAAGNPADIISRFAKELGATKIIAQKEDTDEEVRVEQELEQNVDVPVEYYCGLALVHPDDVPFERHKIPEVFTQFRKKTEKYGTIRDEYPVLNNYPPFPDGIDKGEIPSVDGLGLEPESLDQRAVLAFKGGESQGLKRLDEYFWQRDRLKNYKLTRNGLIGADYSSKLSAWLNNGSLSPRRVYREVKRYEEERTKNKSTYLLVFELLWRDFFRYIARKHGNKIFRKGGVQGNVRHWSNDPEKFRMWREGNTGQDFVDANMRELLLTGYMSNRGRQNVASYLVNELDCDWRWGAAWFENRLIDYDVCSNWGNWMYNSAVGNDPRNRKFNVAMQADKYDKKREYRRLWLNDELDFS